VILIPRLATEQIGWIPTWISIIGSVRPLTSFEYIGILAGSLFGIGLGIYYLVAPERVFRESVRKGLAIARSAWHRWFIRFVSLPFAVVPIALVLRALSVGSSIQALPAPLILLIPMFGVGMVGLVAPQIVQDMLYRSGNKNLQSRWFVLKCRIAGVVAMLFGILGLVLLVIVPFVSGLVEQKK
jgi:hypothetical protein